MKYRWLAAVVSVLGAGLMSVAQTESAFDRITSDILANNPELAAMAADNEADHYGELGANVLPDPEVGGEYLAGPSSEPDRWSVSISQSFDWPGAYRARRQAADARFNAAKQLLQSRRLDMRLKIRSLLIEIIGLDYQLTLLDQILDNLKLQKQGADSAFKSGQITRLDIAKVQFELINLDDQRSQLEQSRSALVRDLYGLNGNKYIDLSTLRDYPAMKLLDEQAYLDAYDRCDPYSDAAKAEIEAAGKELHAVRMSRYPGFSLGYTHVYEDGTHFNGITAAVSLPLYGRNHKTVEANTRIEAARLRLGSYTATRYATIRQQTASAKLLRRHLSRYEDALQQTNYLADIETLFKARQINWLDYITELNYYIDISRQYRQLQCQYMLILNDLNRYD